jgi:transposase
MEQIPRRQYTAEFKGEAVKLVLERGVGIREAARRLDLPVGSLRNWVGAARAGKPLASETVRPVTDLEAENTRLKQEVARLKMEKEILKNRLRGQAASHSKRNTRRYTVRHPDSGRQLFGGTTPSKNLAQGKLRIQCWWRAARPRLGM